MELNIHFLGKSLKEMQEMGYEIVHAVYCRGYVSRKLTEKNIYVCGFGQRGRWKNYPFVLLPNFKSTTYCIKAYLGKD